MGLLPDSGGMGEEMSLRLFISPNYDGVEAYKDNGGIRRVVEAETRHLPKFDVEVVHNPKEADVIQYHVSVPRDSKGRLNAKEYAPGIPIVHSGHGLMWSRQPWGDGMQEVNAEVTEAMAWAVAHTVPSDWVNRAVRRGGLWYPKTIYHGVDAEEFDVPDEAGDYVLWNKARADHVSDPKDMQYLARHMPRTRFLTTIGNRTSNVSVLGNQPHTEMKHTVAHAGVYLATARETFGIGTLEAMACGVPIAGWDWGGQSEIIVQGETGYLAPPGDFGALVDCVNRCFDERERLGANARSDVLARWGWEPRIQQYAELFYSVHEGYNLTRRPTVSVIVTTHHLDKYLPKCLDSVIEQTLGDWECLVIDDANSHLTWKIVEEYEKKDARIKYIATPHNLGLPGARNFGFEYAQGKYIRHLDADDFLAPTALLIEADALNSQPGMHIVYGHLESVNEDGSQIKNDQGVVQRSGWPLLQFDWLGQMAHLNQLPSCVMARREVYQKSGGYRERMHRNEDAEFWCRVTSLGFRARKVTQAVTYYHRQRDDSKGELEWKTEGAEPDWTAWFPWRVGAANFQEAKIILNKSQGAHPRPHLVPFGAQGQCPGRKFWHVHDHAYPVVSVIVTVGPGHKKYLLDALDSVQAQTFPDWECIVVNDTGENWDSDIMGAPWAQVIDTGSNRGTAHARNKGFERARGRYIVWLDGDDFLLPWYLETMVAHAEQNDGVIFSDLFLWEKKDNRSLKIYRYREFDTNSLAATFKWAGSSVLYPRHIVEAVRELQGGYDEQIAGQEDRDWQIAVAHLGFCGYRVPEPLFVYRMWSTTKRESDLEKFDILMEYIDKKWRPYRLEGKQFMCGCSPKKTNPSPPASLMTSSGNFNMQDIVEKNGGTEQFMKVEYIGPRTETFSIRSRVVSQKTYRFGNNAHHKTQTVFMKDGEFLLQLRTGTRPDFRQVPVNAEPVARDPSQAMGMAISG